MSKVAVEYIGRHGAVIVPLPDGSEIEAVWGNPISVDADLAASLLDQEDNWKPADKPERKPAAAAGTDTPDAGEKKE